MPTPNISKFIAYCETELDLQNRLIVDMSSEKHYFLHINPLFGYGTDNGTAELYIDLREATVYPEKHISKD